MCAIAGIIGCMPEDNTLRLMLESMKRRGPDGSGTFRDRECTLLHTRLAIIDPERGAQPMALCLGNEEYIISYNGELYNTEELRNDLVKLGHRFGTHSDTEVLLHAYAEWKEDVLYRLNVIFAFAVFEKHNRRLFMARDRMGVKPLFYAVNNGTLVFASEIKTILASGLVLPKIDREGILQLVMLAPGRKPGSGVFRDIKELEPGWCAYFRDGNLTAYQYWKLTDRYITDTFEETVEEVRWLVTDSIKRQMVSDVPIGTFLSGGLDSSLITAICARESAGELTTFSVDYENNDKYFVPGKFQPNSDGEYIALMKEVLHTKHFYSVLTPEKLVSSLADATKARDLPGMADVDFSLLAFCGDIRKQVKVALSGECADEIFGGYPWYRDPEVRALDGFPWAQNTEFRTSLSYFEQAESVEYSRQCYLDTIERADILPENSAEDRRTKEMVNLNIRWFMQTLLDRKDRMSMYHGLEVRVPFCDHRIAEYLYCVPWKWKDHGDREKGLLRKAMEGVLPEKVLYRKKSPYPKTYDPRYEELVTKELKRIMEDKGSALFHIVRRDALTGLLNRELRWPWYGQLMRKPQTIAYFLQLEYWLQEYKVQFV